jgi:chromate reductase
MANRKVAVLIGSLRKESLTRKYAHAVGELAPASLEFDFIELGDLPLYNQDLDDGGAPPASWTTLRGKIKAADAVLIVTPEHNRSIPAAMKNAIDIASRPVGYSVWNGKPVGVVSQSPGALGGFGANHHVRQTMVTLGAPVMPAPDPYIGSSATYLDEQGKVVNEKTRETLAKFGAAFAKWIEANAPAA